MKLKIGEKESWANKTKNKDSIYFSFFLSERKKIQDFVEKLTNLIQNYKYKNKYQSYIIRSYSCYIN